MTIALSLALTSSPITARVEAASASVTPALAKTPGNSNPLFTQKFGADPFAMVYNGRVYVYMTNDVLEYNTDGTIKDNGYGKINKITVVSSDDMINWTDHGEIPAAGPQGAAKWANNSWAPAAAHKTIDGKEKFFLYFADNGSGIGVLTADSPIGPFTDPIGKQLVSRSTPGASDVTWLFDPAVLVDDDGSGYLYFGGGIPTGKDADPGTARIAKLGADMISLDLAASGGTLVRMNPPWLFEDAGIHKYNGKYYYSYCTNFSSGHPADIPTGAIAYMVSDNPMGPFTFVKTILPNPATFFGVGGNNHHGIFEFNGQWYITYHAQTLAKAMAESGTVPQLGGQPHGYRNAHINKVSFDANGVIQNITGDYKGVPQIKNFDPYTRAEAETIGWNGGISTERITEPGGMVSSINLAVSNIDDGDWTAVSKVDFGAAGAGTFTANVASGTDGGNIELRLDSADGTLIGTLPVSNTGGENSWRTKTTSVSGAAGIHDLYMVYRGASTGNLFKVDYWQFGKKSAAHDLAAINASIDKHKLDIVSGTNKASMKVTAIYTDGTSEDVTAQATAIPAQSGIVSVSNGAVTGVGYGSTSITVSYGGKTDTLNMLVKDLNSELTVKKLTADNSSVSLWTGGTKNFSITAEYFDGRTEDVTNTATYSNPHPEIAEVSNGKITAKSNGITNVIVSFKGVLGNTVTTQLTITVTKLTELLENGGFEAGLAPWTFNDTATLSVSDQVYYSGSHSLYVTGRKTTGSGPKQSVDGKVKAGVTYKYSAKVRYDSGPATRQFNLTIRNEDPVNMSESDTSWWQYKDFGRATITKGVWGTIEGTVTVPADAKFSRPAIFVETSWVQSPSATNDLMDFYVDDVSFLDTTAPTSVLATSVTIAPQALNLKTGGTGTLTATVAPENATNKNLLWASSNHAVATVDQSGNVTAIGAGTTTITAATQDGSGKTAESQVTVTLPESVVLQGPSEAIKGAAFDLNYGLSGMTQNIYAQDVTFTYDPSQLEYVSVESTKPDEVVVLDKAQKQGEVRFIAATLGQNARLDGNLLKLHWKVKSDTPASASTISLSKVIIADEAGFEKELGGSSHTVQLSNVVIDKTALLVLIADAQNKHDEAAEGTGAGQYPAGSKTVLQAAIDQAKAVATNTAATQQQVEQALNELSSALQAFVDSVVRTQPGDVNGDGRYSVGDLAIVAAAYGKTSSDPDWSRYKNLDLNNDGKIDIEDLAIVAMKMLD
nr:carbohydrate-binding protein [Paenibacillus planticolens]